MATFSSVAAPYQDSVLVPAVALPPNIKVTPTAGAMVQLLLLSLTTLMAVPMGKVTELLVGIFKVTPPELV